MPYMRTKDAQKLVSLTAGGRYADMFTSLGEIIHQAATVVGVMGFGQSRPCICSTTSLTNHYPVTLSNYEVWYYGLAF